MIFTGVKSLSIPEGVVKKIDSNGIVLWEEPATYKNWAHFAVDTDKSLYNGCGYMAGYRLNSSGVVKELSGAIHSGYIPFNKGDIIRASGSTDVVTSGGHYFVLCDENFAVLASTTLSNATAASFYGATYVLGDNGLYMLTLNTGKAGSNASNNVSKAKYFRISFAKCTPEIFVITVNEEIA